MRSGDVLVDVGEGRVMASQTLLDGPRGGSVSSLVVEMFSSCMLSASSTKTSLKQFNYVLLFNWSDPFKPFGLYAISKMREKEKARGTDRPDGMCNGLYKI